MILLFSSNHFEDYIMKTKDSKMNFDEFVEAIKKVIYFTKHCNITTKLSIVNDISESVIDLYQKLY